MTLKQKQALLAYLDYYDGPLDGLWGEKSQRATIDFQRAYMEATEVDGIFGTETEKRILEVVASGEEQKESVNIDTVHLSDSDDATKYLQADGCYHIPRGVDVQLTKNFWAHEIHCQGVGCCKESVISKRIMELVQEIRDDIGEPLAIGDAGGSGYRCPVHNAEVNGAANSLHMISDAVDLHYKNPSALKSAVLRHLKDGEVGLYSWGCHVGIWDRGYISQFNG